MEAPCKRGLQGAEALHARVSVPGDVPCVSGREPADGGLPGEADLAAEHDAGDAVPLLLDGAFRGAA